MQGGVMQGRQGVVEAHHQQPGAKKRFPGPATGGGDKKQAVAEAQRVAGAEGLPFVPEGALQRQGVGPKPPGDAVRAGNQDPAGEPGLNIRTWFADERAIELHQGFLRAARRTKIRSVTMPRMSPTTTAVTT